MVEVLVVGVQKGNSAKTQKPYHVLEMLGQDDDGNFGTLKYFLKPEQMVNSIWDQIKVGSVLDLEIEVVKKGFSSYTNIKSVLPTSKTANLDIS